MAYKCALGQDGFTQIVCELGLCSFMDIISLPAYMYVVFVTTKIAFVRVISSLW